MSRRPPPRPCPMCDGGVLAPRVRFSAGSSRAGARRRRNAQASTSTGTSSLPAVPCLPLPPTGATAQPLPEAFRVASLLGDEDGIIGAIALGPEEMVPEPLRPPAVKFPLVAEIPKRQKHVYFPLCLKYSTSRSRFLASPFERPGLESGLPRWLTT